MLTSRNPREERPPHRAPTAPNGEPLRVLIATSVSGGPADWLAQSLSEAGLEASVDARFTTEQWQAIMDGSALSRLRGRVESTFVFPWRVVFRAMRSDNSFIVTTTNPFLLPIVAVATRWLHRGRVVPLVWDLFPDALAAGGWASRGGIVDKVTTRLNRWWIRSADGVVFIGEHVADHVRSRYGSPRNWAVIETGADMREFERAKGPSETDLERWCDGKRIIGYVGHFGRVHDWKTLAEAVPVIVRKYPDVGILIISSGIAIPHLKRHWKDLPESAVRFVSPLDDRAWARILIRTDISVSSLNPGFAKTSIPSKTFSAMAAGAAIMAIAPDDSDLANLVRKHECGEVAHPGDVNGLVSAFAQLLDRPDVLRQRRANALAAVRDDYDMPKLARRWEGLLQRIAT